jgi:chemotaxis protein methyltransferase CheR
VIDREPLLAATRAVLETSYGLALEGLNEDQLRAAVYAAAAVGMADPHDPVFVARVIDRLPIDESWLFRDDGLWEWLRDVAGPDLLQRASTSGRKVRILSLGCSAGQEPFTVAMTFQSVLEGMGLPPSAGATYVEVTGLDSSPARIEAARSGLLSSWSVQRCRPDWLRARATPEPDGRHIVAPSVRAMCHFDVGNLVDVAARGNATLGGYDLVLCRNVLIYFRTATAERIARELGGGLDPGAYLIVSASEAHLLVQDELEPAGMLGVARAAPRQTPAQRRLRGRHAPRRPPPAPAPAAVRKVPRATGASVATPASSRGAAPVPHATVASHLDEALRHAEAGRRDEALRAARAALVHDPLHLYSRLLLGQQMLTVDGARGREVLRGLLDQASRLPPSDEVPCAEGLSVRQLTDAVRILLLRGVGP